MDLGPALVAAQQSLRVLTNVVAWERARGQLRGTTWGAVLQAETQADIAVELLRDALAHAPTDRTLSGPVLEAVRCRLRSLTTLLGELMRSDELPAEYTQEFALLRHHPVLRQCEDFFEPTPRSSQATRFLDALCQPHRHPDPTSALRGGPPPARM